MAPTYPTCALILAAGFSRRFGSDKRQQPTADGRTLLQASIALPCAHFDEVWLALREGEQRPDWLPPQVQVINVVGSIAGLGHSLAHSVSTLSAVSTAEAVAVFLGDMPFIAPATVSRLCAQARADRICRPVHAGRGGHPVMFGRSFWPALMGLTGDEGARQVVATARDQLIEIAVDDIGVLHDVDRPADLVSKARLGPPR